MVKVGDRICLASGKGPDRDGVVTAVTGSMVRVRWPSGDETTVVPAPGTLAVLASPRDQAPAVRRERAAPEQAAAKKTAAKKTSRSTKTPAKKTAAKKTSTSTKTPAKKAAAKKTSTSTKDAAKKATGVKRSSR